MIGLYLFYQTVTGVIAVIPDPRAICVGDTALYTVAHRIIAVGGRAAIGIVGRCHTVVNVVDKRMCVAIEVCVAGAVAILVIAEALALAHWQGTACDTAQRIMGPAGVATFRIGLGQFVACLVVLALGSMPKRIFDAFVTVGCIVFAVSRSC